MLNSDSPAAQLARSRQPPAFRLSSRAAAAPPHRRTYALVTPLTVARGHTSAGRAWPDFGPAASPRQRAGPAAARGVRAPSTDCALGDGGSSTGGRAVLNPAQGDSSARAPTAEVDPTAAAAAAAARAARRRSGDPPTAQPPRSEIRPACSAARPSCHAVRVLQQNRLQAGSFGERY